MSAIKKKEQDIINSGKDLFWKYGIKRVTVEEICENAGVSKMTFYKYFNNKNDLVRAILSIIFKESEEKFLRISEAEIPYHEKARKFSILKMESSEDISKEFMADYYNLNDPDLDNFLLDRTNRLLKLFIESIKEAQQKGEIRKNIKPEFIIYFFNHIPTMITDPQLIDLYPTAQELIMEFFSFSFYGILAENRDA